jgi:hypothetical protein
MTSELVAALDVFTLDALALDMLAFEEHRRFVRLCLPQKHRTTAAKRLRLLPK